MLPDFRGLRQQSRNEVALRSLEHGSDRHSSKSKKVHQSSKNGDGEAFKRNRTPSASSKKRAVPPFIYVEEANNDFLTLWPHRYDYLYAPHPAPDTKPDWQTETRHPLSDRLITQGAYLFGVRPGPETTYALLDIDKGSPYHPQRDPLALTRINEALEPLGLVADLKLTSSASLGLHIYFPCSEALPSWQLGIAIVTLLENKGFKVIPGWLEVFPNRKPYAADGSYSLFNGHRLPLQQGSYLLSDDLQPIASSQQAFVRQWHLAAAHNDISTAVLEQTIRQAKRKAYRVTGKAKKFLNDLNAEIEPGWTGPGQSNHILGRIAMRSYIFGHILGAEAPLSGKALAEDIARVARALPGFQVYCGHQKDLDRRAKDYARSIEREKRYYPYASGKALKVKEGPTENQRRAAEAREHVRQATIELCKQDAFPDGITPRFDLLCACHISGSTLYRNRDLWHPVFISDRQRRLIEVTPELQVREAAACAEGAAAASKETSLLGAIACNTPSDKNCSEPISPESEKKGLTACNTPSDKAFELSETEQRPIEPERTAPPEQLVLNIQWALQVAKANQQAKAEENRQRSQQAQQRRSQDAHRAQLLTWVDSGDPILEAEARRQLSRMETAPQSLAGSG